jgi:hypothetical protein
MKKEKESCCSTTSCSTAKPDLDKKYSERFIISTKITDTGFIPVISTIISVKDKLEHAKCRTSKFRDDYTVTPGLYAIGEPDKKSDVFVSANYKLSFDVLRKHLSGLNCWILVLDTKGINVWCAAGKGTFGTEELINRIKITKLDEIVDHKKIIVPQLGAPGVAAHEVTKATKFKVIYGPVRAEDIKDYINNDYTVDKEMRTVKFPFKDRAVLVPKDVIYYSKYFLCFGIFALFLFGLQSDGILFKPIIHQGLPVVISGFIALLIGTAAVPLFLPTIPFNSFALKGALAGLIMPVFVTFLSKEFTVFYNVYILIICWILLPAISSFLALEFTGTSTYTNPSGVRKELKIALPIYFAACLISLVLIIIYKITTWC